jgi:hypothetical protein
MLLAARALGLGATLRMLHLNFEKEVEAALWLAARRALVCAAAYRLSDWPFGPVRRVPLADVVYEDQWGRPFRD